MATPSHQNRGETMVNITLENTAMILIFNLCGKILNLAVCQILFFLLFANVMVAEEVKVETLLDYASFSIGQEITGTVNVTHPPQEVVDVTSFTYQGQPLAVDYLRKVHFPGSLSLDLESYRFKLPPPKGGLQVVEPIAVKVGKHRYQSIPVSFEVKKMEKGPFGIAHGAKEPFLKLEKIFKGNEPLYPGQKVTLGYRYLFQGAIELREEVIPLIEQNDFPQLGEKQIQDAVEGTVSVREITQQVQMPKAGDYEIPESIISGYAYRDKGWGPKTYLEPKLTSTVPSFKITVLPFPEEGKPPFFYGALGPFEVYAEFNGPPRLEVGDKFTLMLTYRGTGELSTLKPPNLSCQPGWAGFFHTGDLPPQSEKKEGEVSFAYEIRAQNRLVDHIPPIFTAYFDPEKGSYQTIATKRLPLEIVQSPIAEKPSQAPTEITLTAHLVMDRAEETAVNTHLETLLKKLPSESRNIPYLEALGRDLASLERLPEAIWAYQKVLALAPWNRSARHALHTLQVQLNLPTDPTFTFPLHPLYLLFAGSFILLLLLWRWQKPRWICGSLVSVTLILIAYATWLAPLYGVILKPTPLYQTPHGPLVLAEPLHAGLTIEILAAQEEGTWLQVRDKKGNIGFVPFTFIRAI